MLPQIGGGRAVLTNDGTDERLELVAAIFVVPEHIETCESRTQQNVIARFREFRRPSHGFGEVRTTGVGDTEG